MIKLSKDTVFVLYLIITIILAVVYFTMPERNAFFDNQIKWWSEFANIFTEGNSN